MSNQAILRITRELGDIQRHFDLSIAVACRDTDIRDVKAIIIGPPDTPYEFGFFEFSVKFPEEYPAKAPNVIGTTTNGGRCRFNPNIYSNGKVCLSILGTWRGERGEEWSSAQGLESILISIQSLMSGNPYENEPGYETARSKEDQKNMEHYVNKIRHETLRISICQRMEGYLGIDPDGYVAPRPSLAERTDLEEFDEEPTSTSFDPFVDLCKRRFMWYYEAYIQAIDKGQKGHKQGESFKKMPFEGGGNTMDGKYDYAELRRRFLLIRKVLDDETARWAEEGVLMVKRDATKAAQMRQKYEQMVEVFKQNSSVTLDLDLVDKENPFVWQLILFGRPMSNLDGGMFTIHITISPRFPDEQPRVKFVTPLFHHRVAKDGTLCYFPKKPDDLRSHIDAIIEAVEEDHPPYDPRTLVNSEAAKLFWGSGDEKKTYSRQLRRSVQRSME
ncbi:hypothetical protein MMC25_000376 [Agyrium rufum]|nr:hypothetical protein [Agyrium rufum]